MTWLESGPGADRCRRAARRRRTGAGSMCGYGRFGREVTEDLRAEGLDVDGHRARDVSRAPIPTRSSWATATSPWCSRAAGIDAGGGLRRRHRQRHDEPVARRRRPAGRTRTCSSPPGRTARPARRCSRRWTSTRCWCPPRSWPTRSTRSWHAAAVALPAGDARVAATRGRPSVIDRLTELCGEHLQALWKVRLTAAEAPALQAWLAPASARLGDLLRNPDDRDERLHAVPLLVAARDRVDGRARRTTSSCAADDELLLAGRPARPPAAGQHAARRCDPGVRR